MEKDDIINIYNFDGQTIWLNSETILFEIGNYLGGGAAGTVYECENIANHQKYALKILNPLGYKILSPALLRRCTIITKGHNYDDNSLSLTPLSKENVWWLLNPSTKQYLACYFSEKQKCLKELSLNQCIMLWGLTSTDLCLSGNIEIIQINGQNNFIPSVPHKFVDFLEKRNKIFREIRNMRKISYHPNVIKLEAVLELIQESKCSIFLVMELANGGELFDRIKIDCGTREETAKVFFNQLLRGVKHCHDQGVCHRDLKPENLLLHDNGNGATLLKIADFGFSAHVYQDMSNISTPNSFSEKVEPNDWQFNKDIRNFRNQNIQDAVYNLSESVATNDEYSLKVLKSIVGSPFYVAPEVIQSSGYDGMKADIWSMGVILYAMLAGNLPFGQDLTLCKRFRHFCKWVRDQTFKGIKFWVDENIEYPEWLFSHRFSCSAKGLIVSLLHPDPCKRISLDIVMTHPLYEVEFRLGPSIYYDQLNIKPLDQTVFPKEISFEIVSDDENYEEQIFDMDIESDQNTTSNNLEPKSNINAANNFQTSILPMVPDSYLEFSNVQNLFPEFGHDDSDSKSLIFSAQKFECNIKSEEYKYVHYPPSFNDKVKRSTRFITCVPATKVLTTIETILEDTILKKIETPLGIISKIELNWNVFRLEIWGNENIGPSICTLQLYEMPSTASLSFNNNQTLMVEFIRGQVEIFAFKRFYQWLRFRLSEIVNQDYTVNFFEPSSTPK